jgi:hypothetical protein
MSFNQAEFDAAQSEYVSAMLAYKEAFTEDTIRAVEAAHMKFALLKLRCADQEGCVIRAEDARKMLMTAPTPEELAAETAAQRLWKKAHAKSSPALREAGDALPQIIQDRFKISATALRRILNETGAVIGGSVPLQALLGCTWQSSDMDVYVPAISGKLVDYWHGFLMGQGYRLCELREDCAYLRESNKRLGDAIMEVRTYVGHSNSVQIVVCKSVPRVFAAVDLTCTALFYDGHALRTFEDVGLLKRRVAAIRFPIGELRSYEVGSRIAKYRKRGFTILFEDRFAQLPLDRLQLSKLWYEKSGMAAANAAVDALLDSAAAAARYYAEGTVEAAISAELPEVDLPTLQEAIDAEEAALNAIEAEAAAREEAALIENSIIEARDDDDDDDADDDEAAYLEADPGDIAMCEAAMASLRVPTPSTEPDFAPPDVRTALNALSTTIG